MPLDVLTLRKKLREEAWLSAPAGLGNGQREKVNLWNLPSRPPPSHLLFWWFDTCLAWVFVDHFVSFDMAFTCDHEVYYSRPVSPRGVLPEAWPRFLRQ